MNGMFTTAQHVSAYVICALYICVLLMYNKYIYYYYKLKIELKELCTDLI